MSKSRIKRFELQGSHGFKPGALWPRKIAQEFLENDKTSGWVWAQCKKHEHPLLIWQWVTDLITMGSKQLGEKPDEVD